ncbi:hypothetical protein N9K39_04230 [Candidatus Pelagibacter sp.]|nr:hypothetical protein [Candidatus Pelagibacter sp.]
MFKKFLLLIKFFFKTKIVFKEPQEKNIVLFDKEGSSEFINVLKNKKFFLMANRPQHIKKIYLFPGLIFPLIRNFNTNLATTYLATLLEKINPKIVITFSDNSYKFSELAKILNKKIKFFAIQNAFRLDVLENHFLFKTRLKKYNLNKKLFIPYFFCLGQFEVNFYKKYKIKTGKIFKIGSLRLSNAIHYFKSRKIDFGRKFYDICLISDTTYNAHFLNETKNKILEFENLKNGLAQVVKYTINFCMKNRKKLIFITKNKKFDNAFANEMNFYKKRLTKNEYKFLIKSLNKKYLNNYYSYLAMFRSKVTVSTISTMLSENLAVGNKVLACNLTNIKILNFPIKKICSINNCNYKNFEKRLMNLLILSRNKYFSKIGKQKNYLVAFNKKISTIDLLIQQLRRFS